MNELAPPEAAPTPTPSGPLWGREEALDTLGRRLEGGAHVLTVLGPPGVGKTRLAAALADRWAARGRPVWRCDLRPVDTRSGLHGALALALGIQLPPGGDDEAAARLGQVLAHRGRGLCLLDDFEQLVDEAAADVAAWCRVAPEARFLVTSRVQLKLSVENAFGLEGLSCPELGASPDEVLASPAVSLFLDVARRNGCEQPWDRGLADEVADLVRRLEGHPLALELAASRMKLLGVRQLQATLERSFDALGPAPRDAAAHHRSLEKAFDLSWRLLPEPSRDVLEGAAWFGGSFDLGAAEEVLARRKGDGIVEHLEVLVQHSLLEVRSAQPGSPRYDLHPITRELLRRSGLAAAEWKSRIAGHYAERASDGADRWDIRTAWTVAEDRSNLEAALAWADAERDVDAYVDLAVAFAKLVDLIGPAAAIRHHVERAHARARRAPVDDVRRARIGLALGYVRMEAGEPGAWDALEDVRIRSGGGPASRIVATTALATLALRRGDLEMANDRFAEAEDLAATIDDPWLVALPLGARANLELARREPETAKATLRRAGALMRETGDLVQEGVALGLIGNVDHDAGRLAEAYESFEEAVHLLERGGARPAAAIFRAYLAAVLHEAWVREVPLGPADAADPPRAARAAYDRALAGLEEAALARFEGLFRGASAALAATRDDLRRARDELVRAEARLAVVADPQLETALTLHGAHVAVARARRALRRGDPNGHAQGLAQAARTLAAVNPAHVQGSDDVRLAMRLLDCALDRAWADGPGAEHGWIVAREGRAICRGETRLDLSTRHPLRRILWALVLERLDCPGRTVAPEALLGAGWPGERVKESAGRHRLRVAVNELRRAGLRPLLETVGAGYRLTPTEPLWLGPAGGDGSGPDRF